MDDRRMTGARLDDLAAGFRGALGSLSAAVESLQSFPNAPEERRSRWLTIVAEENRRLLDLVHRLEELPERGQAPAAPTAVGDLTARLAQVANEAGLELIVAPASEPELHAATPPALAAAFGAFCAALRRHYTLGEAQLVSARSGELLIVDLVWPLDSPSAELEAWLARSVDTSHGGAMASLRELARTVGGEAWTLVDRDQTRGRLRLLLPLERVAHATT